MTAEKKMQIVALARKVSATLPLGDHKEIAKGWIAYKDITGQCWIIANDLRFIDAIIDDRPAKKL